MLSAVLSISHLNTLPQEGNRSPAKFRREREGERAREKEREIGPHTCSSSQVENCDRSTVKLKECQLNNLTNGCFES